VVWVVVVPMADRPQTVEQQPIAPARQVAQEQAELAEERAELAIQVWREIQGRLVQVAAVAGQGVNLAEWLQLTAAQAQPIPHSIPLMAQAAVVAA
jgi:hypothetical protein